jgi:hypothetical protein
VHPVSITLSRLHFRQEALPHESVDLDQRHARLGAVVVEQAQLDTFGDLAEYREVRA